MTRIYEDPATFTDDMLAGFADLQSRYVTRVPGGVVRATGGDPKVAVIVGGGSGHYPAFCGVVGPGFADGAVVGNIFTSPSTADAVSVGRAASSGRGVLLLTGNYAGDVINFTQAAETLTAEGIETQFLVVTDDVASAPADQQRSRRGIAGDFVVFKTAAAAAETGYDLAEVARVAQRTNDRTRTLGTAFSGCTLPGASEPLFTVAPGQMSLGLGIHGEPGILDRPMPSAPELAKLLVDGVLADAPACEDRKLAVILNGLGATKYEELFLLWGHVATLLREADFELCEPEVGELVTSLDMAGCSLTASWLDPELERFWRAPVDTPAYRKGQWAHQEHARVLRTEHLVADEAIPVTRRLAADEPARQRADRALHALEAMAVTIAENAVDLGHLDSYAGDGDHGRGMVKGTSAAVDAARQARSEEACAGDVLRAAGAAWAASAGGTSGALWGAILDRLGELLEVTPIDIPAAMQGAYDAAAQLGGAKPGDKTMLDSFLPFCDTLSRRTAEGDELAVAWETAAAAASVAASRTAELRPRVGRARPLAERSVGHADPGATSFALCVTAALAVFTADVG